MFLEPHLQSIRPLAPNVGLAHPGDRLETLAGTSEIDGEKRTAQLPAHDSLQGRAFHTRRLLDDPHFLALNIANFQTRVLGADGVCDPHEVGQSDGVMLTRAICRLETLDFVGLTERFGESCALFDARFGTAISRSVRRDLVHRPEGSELAEFIPRLEPLLEHDRALYERAQAAFVPAG